MDSFKYGGILTESFVKISSSVNRFKSYRICSAFFTCKEVKNPSIVPEMSVWNIFDKISIILD